MEETGTNVNLSIFDALNNFFSSLFSSVDNGIYEILDKITFIDTKIIEKNSFINYLVKIVQVEFCLFVIVWF